MDCALSPRPRGPSRKRQRRSGHTGKSLLFLVRKSRSSARLFSTIVNAVCSVSPLDYTKIHRLRQRRNRDSIAFQFMRHDCRQPVIPAKAGIQTLVANRLDHLKRNPANGIQPRPLLSVWHSSAPRDSGRRQRLMPANLYLERIARVSAFPLSRESRVRLVAGSSKSAQIDSRFRGNDGIRKGHLQSSHTC